MTSKSRVRAAIRQETPDRIPASFNATAGTIRRLVQEWGVADEQALRRELEIDLQYIEPAYTGPVQRRYRDADGLEVEEHYFGWKSKYHWSGADYTPIVFHFPLDEAASVKDLEDYPWPDPGWFDYETVARKAGENSDLALIIGGFGNYQVTTKIRSPEKIYTDMALNPDFAKALFRRFHCFEMEHYERILKAGGGAIDILRVYDDYGTQNSLLFSPEMWREYFRESTRELADLAHSYGAFFMQHSCGAVRPLIPDLIACGVDILDPLQKVPGLEPESLRDEFGGRIAFHGGIDTQQLLPFGGPRDVAAEVERYTGLLGARGGYILSPSQAFQGDVPAENIREMYRLEHRALRTREN